MTDIFNTIIKMADIGMSGKEIMMTFVTSKKTRIYPQLEEISKSLRIMYNRNTFGRWTNKG